MKNAPSLEEERQALLEQIHASRAAYRRMLTEQDEQAQAAAESRLHGIREDPAFPRSRTIRWIMQHPYISAAAVAGVVGVAIASPRLTRSFSNWRAGMSGTKTSAIATGRIPVNHTGAGRRITDRSAVIDRPPATPKRVAAAGRAAITSVAAMAATVLRDPSKMRMATRFFSMAAGFISARRARRLQ
jgi:hypothetical protein